MTFVCELRIWTRAGRGGEFVAAIFEDLQWLGLSWKEPVLCQSRRMEIYRGALQSLKDEGLVYACFCTRKEIADEIARATEAYAL